MPTRELLLQGTLSINELDKGSCFVAVGNPWWALRTPDHPLGGRGISVSVSPYWIDTCLAHVSLWERPSKGSDSSWSIVVASCLTLSKWVQDQRATGLTRWLLNQEQLVQWDSEDIIEGLARGLEGNNLWGWSAAVLVCSIFTKPVALCSQDLELTETGTKGRK